MKSDKLVLRGARQHNLKNIDLEIPKNSLTVITGLSGSGKSTLAFDTLYAEGQRRYVESLSTYARQFLERMDKPDADLIEGLSPAIAIEQKTASHNPRSTVGTVTEIYDYLRLLYARVGTPYCPRCHKPVTHQSIDQMVAEVLALPERSKVIILGPVAQNRKGDPGPILKKLRKQGFSRIHLNGEMQEIDDLKKLNPKASYTIDVVVDRLIIKSGIRNRLADSLELALGLSDGLAVVDVIGGEHLMFNEKAACVDCGTDFPELTPACFSFNAPQGACSDCKGLGAAPEFDESLIIFNEDLSLREGAVDVWAERSSVQFTEFLDALTAYYGVDIYTPYRELPDVFKKVLLHGTREKIPFYFEKKGRRHIFKNTFEGIIPALKRRLAEADTPSAREELSQYMSPKICPACEGFRLNETARSVRINKMGIGQVTALTIMAALDFFHDLPASLTGRQGTVAGKIIKEIADRLGFLRDVGLGYLTLDRSAATLSGGESQRIRLATQIGSKLTGVLYVLDEPSIGLHQRDNRRLLSTLMKMRDLGNTVLVVEHDDDTILAADYIVDMGPGAGVRGGEVVFSGPPEALMQAEHSLTGQYLSGKKRIHVPEKRRTGDRPVLSIKGAAENNLQGIDVDFPLGSFVCVTGVSGSGKSTLVLEILHKALTQKLNFSRTRPGAHAEISGVSHVDKVINIDQSPIGRTPRSNPGTYSGVFHPIRSLFAQIPEAKIRGYKPGRFSFNVKGGRCEACQGDGVTRIEMHFLPDVYVTCDVCGGRRYNRETLEIRYKGKNIADVLAMTVNQSLLFFENIGNIRNKLQTLADVGLGYIQIGQQGTTLSGGEAQRVKLAKELSKRATGRTVYILDEPTTGLHIDDIQRLLNVLNRLVDMGNTVVVIEHHMDVIKCADAIIDLGPEGGDQGGRVVAQGTPEEVAAVDASYTGQYLKKYL